jgi:hypothetical protein
MIPTPLDRFGFVVQRLASPDAAQQKRILVAAKSPPKPHHKPSDEADLV